MATKVTNGLDLSSQKIVNVADPTADQDAATKKFVDDHNWASTDITDFAEAVDDQVNTLIVAGTGITKTYNDGAGTLTLAASGTADKVTVYTSNDSWSKSTNAQWVEIYIWDGGAGGSRTAGATNSTVSGGAGGLGGGFAWYRIKASALSGTVSVTIGGGGSGATAVGSGATGGSSSFGTFSVGGTFNIRSNSGGNGGGVSNASSANNFGIPGNGSTGGNSVGSLATSYTNGLTLFATALNQGTGGTGGTAAYLNSTGTATAGNGGNGSSNSNGLGNTLSAGAGGGGGGGAYNQQSTGYAVGGNGANGSVPGGGGGGGGSARVGVGTAINPANATGGNGGNGAAGAIVIVEIF